MVVRCWYWCPSGINWWDDCSAVHCWTSLTKSPSASDIIYRQNWHTPGMWFTIRYSLLLSSTACRKLMNVWCMSVCMPVNKIFPESCGRISVKFSRSIGHGTRTKWLDFVHRTFARACERNDLPLGAQTYFCDTSSPLRGLPLHALIPLNPFSARSAQRLHVSFTHMIFLCDTYFTF